MVVFVPGYSKMAIAEDIPMEHERHSIALESDLIIIVQGSKRRIDGEQFVCVHEFVVYSAAMREPS